MAEYLTIEPGTQLHLPARGTLPASIHVFEEDALLAVNAANAFPEATHSPLGALWASSNPTSVYVDDFSFGPAPFLTKLPPPPGTEHNPPFDNQEAEGDPAQGHGRQDGRTASGFPS